jgi:hypothetical protein
MTGFNEGNHGDILSSSSYRNPVGEVLKKTSLYNISLFSRPSGDSSSIIKEVEGDEAEGAIQHMVRKKKYKRCSLFVL